MLPLTISQPVLTDFCRQWQVRRLALFGSVLRPDFGPDSDVDVLIAFLPEARWSLFDLVEMQEELQRIFNREVDLVEQEAIEQSDNYIRRASILRQQEVLYAAG